MKTKPPLVSIVVVNYNNLTLLINCLRSLEKQTYPEIEIIVVDNASEDDISGYITAHFPEITLVALDKNYGFAEGNNRGFQVAKGKYVALINNDAVADSKWIASMVMTIADDPQVGAVASIIIDGNEPEKLDSVGVAAWYDGMSRQCMRKKKVPQIETPYPVFLFSGCACLIDKAILEKAGYFDDDFFAYCEDTDLSMRIQRLGYAIVVAPGAYVTHYYSMTGGKSSLKKIYWVERNHLWVAIKNFPLTLLLLLPFFTFMRYGYMFLALKKKNHALQDFVLENAWSDIFRTYVKAYLHGTLLMPKMIHKRKKFEKSNHYIRSILPLIIKFPLSLKNLFD